jgi:outer membrane protein insertion porin family
VKRICGNSRRQRGRRVSAPAAAWLAFARRFPPALPILLLAIASSVGAQDIPEARAYKGWTVASLEILGVPDEMAPLLKDGLALAGQKRLVGTRKTVFFPRILQDDLRRTHLFLARNGYPYAEVGVEFAPVDTKDRNVAVVLSIVPGPPVLVARVTREGLPPGIKSAASEPDLVVGQRFRDEAADEAARGLETALRTGGYAFARVQPKVAREDSFSAQVTLVAESGARVRFGRVRTAGVPDDLVPLVHKTVDLPQGDWYFPEALRQGQEGLRALGLFRQVRLGIEPAAGDTVDVAADLLTRKYRLWEISAGYWTDDFLRVRTSWTHRNLFHAGRGAEVHGSASRFRRAAGTSAWWPALLGSRTRTTAALDVRIEDEDSYWLASRQLELSATWRRSTATAVRAGIALQDVDLDVHSGDATSFLEQGGLMTVFSLRWERDTVDDRISPRRGGLSSAGVVLSPLRALSDNEFVSLNARAVRYRSLTRGIVLAGRLEVGWARPLGQTEDLLPDRRFFAGGVSTMRGARRRALGPTDVTGDPIGGEALLLASTEIRFPLFWHFRGSVFIDTGQVWTDHEAIEWDEFEAAIGPGLMIETPVGPLRVDLGFNVTNRPAGESPLIVHLAIGHPF